MKRERESQSQLGVSHTTIHPSTHTNAHLDLDCITCFSMDPLFGFTIYEMQVCHVIIPYLELHKGFIFSREEKIGKDCPSKEPYTMSNSRGSF